MTPLALMPAAQSVPPHPVAASGVFNLTIAIILIPLVSSAVLLLAGRRVHRIAPALGVAAPAASFLIALVGFFGVLSGSSDERSLNQHLYTWIPVNGLHVDLGLLLDPLSMTFVLLITGVGSIIHLYSVGYMADDPGRRRFFGFMNFFVAVMLLLLLGNKHPSPLSGGG